MVWQDDGLVDLVRDENKRKSILFQPTFRWLREFNEELTAIERYKASVCLNKPIHAGFCVVELSKLVMYDFYYNKLEINMRLLFTGTDSLIIEVCGKDNIFDIMKEHSEEFDFSNCPYEHGSFSIANKEVPGKFKDETASTLMIESIHLGHGAMLCKLFFNAKSCLHFLIKNVICRRYHLITLWI